MYDNITYLYSDDTHKSFAQPSSPAFQPDRVREWSGIERTVNNHLMMGLSVPRRNAAPKKKPAHAGHGLPASSCGTYAAAALGSHG
jgi:hypothetical protein